MLLEVIMLSSSKFKTAEAADVINSSVEWVNFILRNERFITWNNIFTAQSYQPDEEWNL